jgi:hypothetical protein
MMTAMKKNSIAMSMRAVSIWYALFGEALAPRAVRRA